MILLEETITMAWRPSNRATYENRGYEITGYKTVFNPLVSDVVECSCGARIPVQCDYCGGIYYPTVRNYEKVKLRGEKDCCVPCKGKKIKDTVRLKYKVDNVSQVKEIRDKTKKTCMDRYGVDTPLKSKDIFQKTQDSVRIRYGVDNCAKLQWVVEKRKNTMRERYGCDYPMQNKDIFNQIINQMYKNGSCKTSNRQTQLREMLNNIYGKCELNYPCDKVSLDCMCVIDGVKFDIEYDGWYWHKDKQEEDNNRNLFVVSCGYKVIRIIAKKGILPTIEQIKEAVNFLLTTNENVTKIILE